MRNTYIYVYIILIFKLNVNSFLYTYIRSVFNSRCNKNVAFDKIKCFYCCFLR